MSSKTIACIFASNYVNWKIISLALRTNHIASQSTRSHLPPPTRIIWNKNCKKYFFVDENPNFLMRFFCWFEKRKLSKMTETSNIKSIFKKFDQIDPTTDASWKYLIQLFKKCNIQNKSNDLNLLNDAKFEKCRLGKFDYKNWGRKILIPE